MLSWLTLHVFSPYTASLIIVKARNCLVIACNCTAHAQPMSQQTMGPLSILQQLIQHVPTHFGEAWPMLKASHQHYSPHNMPICSTQSNCHQSTSTCPRIQIASTSLMPCTQHSIITATQPCLTLQPPSPHTRNPQLSHQCHAPPHRVSTTCCYPSSKPSLPTIALLCHGLGALRGAKCLHMLPLITTHRSNSSRKIGLVLLKEPLGASLVRHEGP